MRRRVTYDPWTYNGVKSVISISPCEKEGLDDLFTYLTHVDCIWRMNGERVSLGSVDGVVADDADGLWARIFQCGHGFVRLCACSLPGSTYFNPEQSITSTENAWMPGDYLVALL